MTASEDGFIRVWNMQTMDLVMAVDAEEPILKLERLPHKLRFYTLAPSGVTFWQINHVHYHLTAVGETVVAARRVEHLRLPARIITLAEGGAVHLVSPPTGQLLTSVDTRGKERKRWGGEVEVDGGGEAPVVEVTYSSVTNLVYCLRDDGRISVCVPPSSLPPPSSPFLSLPTRLHRCALFFGFSALSHDLTRPFDGCVGQTSQSNLFSSFITPLTTFIGSMERSPCRTPAALCRFSAARSPALLVEDWPSPERREDRPTSIAVVEGHVDPALPASRGNPGVFDAGFGALIIAGTLGGSVPSFSHFVPFF